MDDSSTVELKLRTSKSSHRRAISSLLSIKKLQAVMSEPIYSSSSEANEDFYDPQGPSLTKLFTAYSQLIREGKIKLRPATERQREDEPIVARIAASGPVPFAITKKLS